MGLLSLKANLHEIQWVKPPSAARFFPLPAFPILWLCPFCIGVGKAVHVHEHVNVNVYVNVDVHVHVVVDGF